ncbi:protein of unknown function [Maridesulfovibrio hydrothermalis AM13 = DSM 14728]|uniref:Uncharacterized protein n=1 Tax=Maridesulfovibrio hydrothermalis AM13 = DSM 14728 TaxID=1121451 RepID=L0R805_9BACT|nr:protein of unknown function [Maridesulfovibrio hydrothermalis AM13 = DSM 14728]
MMLRHLRRHRPLDVFPYSLFLLAIVYSEQIVFLTGLLFYTRITG